MVRAGGVKYICPAIGRSLRKTVRTEMKWHGSTQMLAPGLQVDDQRIAAQTDVKDTKEADYADFVETEIVRLADADRLRRGIEARSEEEYELGAQARTPAGLARDRRAGRARGGRALSWLIVRPASVGAQMPAAALMSSRRASSRAAAEIRAASTPASGSTGTTTSR